jgi:hypothetical protein
VLERTGRAAITGVKALVSALTLSIVAAAQNQDLQDLQNKLLQFEEYSQKTIA